MMAGTLETRGKAYGQQRHFTGLEAFAIGLRLKKARQLLERVIADRGPLASLLELGCGYWGSNLTHLAKEFPQVQFSGVDLAVSSEPSQNIQLSAANLEAWQPAQMYDAVLSLAVLEHLLDPKAHFALISACLKPGGLCALTTPTPPSHFVLSGLAKLGIFDAEEIRDHKSYYTERGLRSLAANADLVVEDYTQMSFGMNQSILLRKTN
jgi:trans-aconitate methyltransferase